MRLFGVVLQEERCRKANLQQQALADQQQATSQQQKTLYQQHKALAQQELALAQQEKHMQELQKKMAKQYKRVDQAYSNLEVRWARRYAVLRLRGHAKRCTLDGEDPCWPGLWPGSQPVAVNVLHAPSSSMTAFRPSRCDAFPHRPLNYPWAPGCGWPGARRWKR